MTIRRFVFNMLEVNTYVLADEESREAVVIDAACMSQSECLALDKYITDNRLQPKHLLNTHLHFDHIFGNRHIYEHYGLKTEASAYDEDWLVEAPKRTRMFGLSFPGQPVAIGRYLNEGDTVTFGQCTLQCLAVPGHSRGSLVFHSIGEKCIFSGDALFKRSIGRTDLPGGDHQTLLQSIREKLLVLPDETIVHPGHGDSTTIGEEKRSNWFLTC